MANLFTKITAESAGSTPYEFSSVTVETDNVFAPSTEQAAVGSYSYKAAYGGTNDVCFGRKNFSESNTAYIIARIYIPSTFQIPVGTTNYTLTLCDGNTYLFNFRIRRETGQDAPNTLYASVRGTASSNISGFATDSWITMKMWYKAATTGNTDGEAKIWIGDTEQYSSSHNTTLLPDNIKVGEWYSTNVPESGSAIYYDEIEGMDAIPSGGTGNSYYYQQQQM
jgi:hypothetical protein